VPLDPLEDIKPKWRTLVLNSVALSLLMGQTGYQISAYGQLSIDAMISAWIAVTATLVVLMLVPTNKRAKLRVHIWVLAIPSVWIIGRLIVVALWGPKALLHPAFYLIGAIS
jgi:hypothetical protein